MKILTLCALLGVSSNALTVKEVGLFAEGLVVGALKQEGLGDLVQCFEDVEIIGEDAYQAIQDFEERSFEGTKAGIAQLGAAVEEIAVALGDCKSIKTDISKIIKMAAIFKSPLTFAYHVGKDLVVNGV